MGFVQSPSLCHVCLPLSIRRYVTTSIAPLRASETSQFPPHDTDWLTLEGIIPTPDAPVLPTPVQTPAVPPTPELSNASTPANTTYTVPTPSDRGKKRARREVVSG